MNDRQMARQGKIEARREQYWAKVAAAAERREMNRAIANAKQAARREQNLIRRGKIQPYQPWTPPTVPAWTQVPTIFATTTPTREDFAPLSPVPVTPMVGWAVPTNPLSGLGETFPYKTVSCADLEKRIGRLAVNKRIKEQAYQKNYGLFTNEFNARCGGSIVTTIKKPGSPVVQLVTPIAPPPPPPAPVAPPVAPVVVAPKPPDFTTQTQFVGGPAKSPVIIADPVTGKQTLIPQDAPAPSMWSSPWVKGVAVVGALGIAFMLYKRSRR